MSAIYPVWFRCLCTILRKFFHPIKLRGAENICTPCVFVARHLNNYGPVAAYLYVPVPFHLWTYYPFVEPKAYAEHVVKYTFTQRMHLPRWLAKIFAQILKYPSTWAYGAVGMIPVYRGMHKVIKTMEITVDQLEKGESVLIFPDVDYTESKGALGELYTGFIRLGRMYYLRTGKRLLFQPICIDRLQHSMRFAKPIEYDPTKSAQAEKERILNYLRLHLQCETVHQPDSTQTAPHTT